MRDQVTEPSASCGRGSEAEEGKNKEYHEAASSETTVFFQVSHGFESRHSDQKTERVFALSVFFLIILFSFLPILPNADQL